MKQYPHVLGITVAVMLLLLICVTYGCAHRTIYQRGMKLLSDQQYEQATTVFEEAHSQYPDDIKITIALDRARADAASVYARRGQQALSENHWNDAEMFFVHALEFDSANALARDGLRTLALLQESQKLFEKGQQMETNNDLAGAEEAYKEALQADPSRKDIQEQLDTVRNERKLRTENPKTNQISFMFQQAGLGEVFRALGAVSGTNILLDDTVDVTRPVTVELNNVSFREAVDALTPSLGLMAVDIEPQILLIVPDTKENRQKYAQEKVRVFMLRYADSEQVKRVLDPILTSGVVLSDSRLNAVVIRAAAEEMELAVELVSTMDMRESEVMVELDVLEVSRGKIQEVGMRLSDSPAISLKLGGGIKDSGGSSGRLSLAEIQNLSKGHFFLTFPSVIVDLLKQDSKTRILAQPRLRILNRVPARLHIGEKVPVKVTTSRYRDTSEETSVYEYRDVGLLVEMTPKVISETELTLDLRMEISSIVKEDVAGQPTIGTREVTTTLRLRDGETEIIAGLIKDEERSGTTKIPFVGDIPILGRIFSSVSNDVQQTDIVVSLTPHLLEKEGARTGDREIWHKTGSADYLRGSVSATTASAAKFRSEGPVASEKPATEIPAQKPGESDEETTAGGMTTVRLNPGIVELKPGESCEIEIRIENAHNAGSVPFYLEYNPDIIAVGSVREGSFMSRDGQATAFMTSVNDERGRLIVGLTRLGSGEGIAGSGVLVIVELIGKVPGESSLIFTHQSVKDPWAETLPAEFIDGRATVIND
ncbi:hypothetical protein JW979_13950 [bacterium]|nr:hypothetical protein [candidate division CSSED10-310 bacterium]